MEIETVKTIGTLIGTIVVSLALIKMAYDAIKRIFNGKEKN